MLIMNLLIYIPGAGARPKKLWLRLQQNVSSIGSAYTGNGPVPQLSATPQFVLSIFCRHDYITWCISYLLMIHSCPVMSVPRNSVI
jgi:hypothetical protein